ncbi:7 transmembrane receptor (rhodopsin family) [Popillia japonica]|uniref:7 transmembrane receptor (Rhodopsin family) n=1 Tax=Popillia japonica TaxID=7064 RepID=A0AAW1LKC7_POPJA
MDNSERYIAICHPLLLYNTADLSKTVKIIVGLWITAFCLAVPKGILYALKYFKYTVKSMFLPFGIYFMVIGIVPLLCSLCCYILIILELKKENIFIRSNRTVNHKKIIKMLVAVVISQFCCWIPLQLVRLYLEYVFIAGSADYAIITGSWSLDNVAVIVSSLFYFLSTTINPILYNVMSRKFKRAFKDTFLTIKIC